MSKAANGRTSVPLKQGGPVGVLALALLEVYIKILLELGVRMFSSVPHAVLAKAGPGTLRSFVVVLTTALLIAVMCAWPHSSHAIPITYTIQGLIFGAGSFTFETVSKTISNINIDTFDVGSAGVPGNEYHSGSINFVGPDATIDFIASNQGTLQLGGILGFGSGGSFDFGAVETYQTLTRIGFGQLVPEFVPPTLPSIPNEVLVPEPSAIILLILGLVSLGAWRYKRVGPTPAGNT